jgi:hypothetical protein
MRLIPQAQDFGLFCAWGGRETLLSCAEGVSDIARLCWLLIKYCPYSKQMGEQAGYLGVMQLEAIVGVVTWYSACIRGTEGNVTAHKKSSRLVVPFLFLILKRSRVGRGCKGYM